MPFVKRDKHGRVIAVSDQPGAGCDEELPKGDEAIAAFLDRLGSEVSPLETSDHDLIRVLEDLVDLLIAKGLILFTDLPVDAQQKIMHRQQMRHELGSRLDLIEED
jgi:hypothetical protein